MANKNLNKMKFCFVMPFHVSENKGGGSEVQAVILAKELALRGFEVFYITQSVEGKAGKTELVDNVKIKWIKYARYFCWENALDYYKTLKDINPDIVVQRHSGLITGIIGYYTKKYKKKFIWICNDNRVPFKWTMLKNKRKMFPIYKVKLFKRIILFLDTIVSEVFRHWGIKQVSLAFAQNKFQKNFLKEEFGLESYHIYSAQEISHKCSAPEERLGKKIVLWSGNLGAWKRPEKFFELARFDTKSKFNFVMTGSKEDIHYLNRLISKKPDNVKWLDRLSFSKNLNLFDQTAFFINTSVDEGFPNTYIQAWMRGVPVLSLGADPDNIIQKYKLGYVCKNIENIWQTLNHLLDNNKEYFEIARRAREYAERNHTIDNMTNDFLEIVFTTLYEEKWVLPVLRPGNKNSEKTLRFGVMCDSLVFKSWEVECIKHVLNLESTSLELFLLYSKETKLKKFGFLSKLIDFRSLSRAFFIIYRKLFLNSKCCSKIDLSEEIRDIDKIYWFEHNTDISKKFFSDEELENIKSKNLDFIISFSKLENINTEILEIPKYGVWAYHHDDEEKYKGNVPCFWEIYHNDNVNGAILKKLTPDRDKYIVLRRGFFNTVNYSYKRNLENVYLQSIEWLKDICTDLFNDNADYLNNLPINSKAEFYSEPDNLEFIKFYLKLLKNRLYKLYKNLFLLEQWNIGYIERSISELIDNDENFKINWFFPMSREFSYADPFPIKRHNDIYVFYEFLDFNKGKGEICSLVFNPSKKRTGDIKECMAKRFHLSYPFIIDNKDETYLIPESWKANEVALYKSIEFPNVWAKKAILLESIEAADPTLFVHNGLWWLCCTIGNQGWNQKLHIFYSETLFGPWCSHKKNPVKTDIMSSRPAGRVFNYGGLLIRPSQDCSKAYGRRIVLNKVTKLTPYEFEEEPLKIIEPSKGSGFEKGIHTINAIDNITIVDGRRDIFSIKKFLKKIKRN